MIKLKQFERYPTRNGGGALVLSGGPGGGMAAVYTGGGVYAGTFRFRPDGRASKGYDGPWDILPPEPETRTVWVNVYCMNEIPGWLFLPGGSHATRSEADRYMSADRVGCHRITLRAEFEPDDAS